MNRPHIVVVGSVNVDMVVKSSRIPVPGETITGGEFVCVPGGKGANQAVAAARLGARVSLVAKVGNDVYGDQAIEGYRQEGIETRFILRDAKVATGVALILVDEAGENLISVAPGANHALVPRDILAAADLIREADVIMLQLEIPLDTVATVARLAAEGGIPVMLDPAPAPEGPLAAELLRCISFLTPNETEAQRLTGIRVTDQSTARAAAEQLLAAGAKCVIVTLGKSGALLVDANGSQMIEAFPVVTCDTTAAGDAFNAALACAIGSGESVEAAVVKGCAAGALAASRLGAQTSLPTAAEVQQFMDDSPRIIQGS